MKSVTWDILTCKLLKDSKFVYMTPKILLKLAFFGQLLAILIEEVANDFEIIILSLFTSE